MIKQTISVKKSCRNILFIKDNLKTSNKLQVLQNTSITSKSNNTNLPPPEDSISKSSENLYAELLDKVISGYILIGEFIDVLTIKV